MLVYGDEKSASYYKIELACALLNIDDKWIDVDIMAGEFKTAAFKALNSNAKIPLLVINNGQTISESNAIVNYLAFNSPPLSSERFVFAKVQQWQFFEQYSHEPYIAIARFINKYLGMPSDRKTEHSAKQSGGRKALTVMNEQLAHSNFIAGEPLSCADISLFTYTHVADEGGFDLSTYPNIQAWIKRILAHTSFVAMGT